MRILFIDGTAGFSPTRINEKPTGGIITSLTLIPRALAAYGYDVTVLSVHQKDELIEGVRYTQNPSGKYDIVVFNRNVITRPLVNHFKDAVKIWWLHDICQLDYVQDDGYKYADMVVALSEYCKESHADFYGVPYEKFLVIPNGVDKSVFYPGSLVRDRNLFICATAPVKGLHPVDFIYYQMKRNNPDFELRLYCDQALHDFQNDEKQKATLKMLAEKGVKVLDPIPQRQLATVMRKAWCMIFPSHYPENCSNLLLQAQACGLPVVSTNIGAASEFIEHEVTGLLTHTTPADMYWWWKNFTSLTLRMHKELDLHKMISRNSPKAVMDWTEVAKCWNELIIDAVGRAA